MKNTHQMKIVIKLIFLILFISCIAAKISPKDSTRSSVYKSQVTDVDAPRSQSEDRHIDDYLKYPKTWSTNGYNSIVFGLEDPQDGTEGYKTFRNSLNSLADKHDLPIRFYRVQDWLQEGGLRTWFIGLFTGKRGKFRVDFRNAPNKVYTENLMELEKKILYLMDHITFRLNGVTLGENGPKISNNVSKEDLVEAFNHMINTKDRYKTSAELDMILKDSSLLSKTNFMIDNDIIEPEKIFNSLSEVLRSKKGYAEILSSDIACKKLELLFKFPL